MKVVDLSKFSVGEELVYRQHDAASQRVRVVKAIPTTRSARVDVKVLDAGTYKLSCLSSFVVPRII